MSVILRHYFFKTQRGQRISPSEIDPNPILSRTDADLSRDVENEMDALRGQRISPSEIDPNPNHTRTEAEEAVISKQDLARQSQCLADAVHGL